MTNRLHMAEWPSHAFTAILVWLLQIIDRGCSMVSSGRFSFLPCSSITSVQLCWSCIVKVNKRKGLRSQAQGHISGDEVPEGIYAMYFLRTLHGCNFDAIYTIRLFQGSSLLPSCFVEDRAWKEPTPTSRRQVLWGRELQSRQALSFSYRHRSCVCLLPPIKVPRGTHSIPQFSRLSSPRNPIPAPLSSFSS